MVAFTPSFNGSTVREPWLCSKPVGHKVTVDGFNGSTVREPWLCGCGSAPSNPPKGLQWVHGPRTVVMQKARDLGDALNEASFNGSTVREPWLCFDRFWDALV